MASWAAAAAMLAAAGCALPSQQPVASAPPAAPPRVAIVAAERGAETIRLVAIDEHGDRQYELIEPAAAAGVRDTNPAVSPNGKWLVFVSTRGGQPGLWIASLGVDAVPRRLTDGAGSENYPVWRPDGSGVVFASTRARGNFDVWQLAITGGVPGALTQLTDGPGHEVAPAVLADGTIIYTQITPDEAKREIESHLVERRPDGTSRALTRGPGDSSPAVSPDGTRLVYAAPQLHDGAVDAELWLLVRATGETTRLVDLPLTDESGPVWSRDGRFVFATSVWFGEGHRPLFSSVIHIDTAESPPVARMLGDRAGPLARLTPAIAAARLDASALRADPEYVGALAYIMNRAAEHMREGQP